MTRDYYADGYEIAERLQEQGHRDWSDRISSAIETGSTSTEILMGIRWQLTQLIEAVPSLDAGTQALAESLRSDIDAALG